MSRIIIIGAGPGGCILAHTLAINGVKVDIFDNKVPWEKPCGGILPYNVTSRYINMNDYPYNYNYYEGIHFISYNNEVQYVRNTHPFHVVSRNDLSKYLMNKLHEAGISIVSEKVKSITLKNGVYNVLVGTKKYSAEIIVGSDGANSMTRRSILGAIPSKHKYVACGYYLDDGRIDKCHVKFSDFPGYMWIMSCPDHSTAGIIAQNGFMNSKKLYEYLNGFIAELYPSAKVVGKYGTYIPSASDPSFYDQPCCGTNWILVGDAAGHVEPIMGEGIYYALKSGEFAAKAILSGNILSYDKSWLDEYGDLLKSNSKNKKLLLSLSEKLGPEIYGAFLYKQICERDLLFS
jgi:menaquinone-9 beta-reductase